MSFQKALDASVEQYAANPGPHHAMFGAGPVRSTADVKGALSNLWTELLALGTQVNWQVVWQQLWTIIGQLYGGKNIQDIIAWLMTLFAPPKPGPVVP